MDFEPLTDEHIDDFLEPFDPYVAELAEHYTDLRAAFEELRAAFRKLSRRYDDQLEAVGSPIEPIQ